MFDRRLTLTNGLGVLAQGWVFGRLWGCLAGGWVFVHAAPTCVQFSGNEGVGPPLSPVQEDRVQIRGTGREEMDIEDAAPTTSGVSKRRRKMM